MISEKAVGAYLSSKNQKIKITTAAPIAATIAAAAAAAAAASAAAAAASAAAAAAAASYRSCIGVQICNLNGGPVEMGVLDGWVGLL